jgi:hypothetical protein
MGLRPIPHRLRRETRLASLKKLAPIGFIRICVELCLLLFYRFSTEELLNLKLYLPIIQNGALPP